MEICWEFDLAGLLSYVVNPLKAYCQRVRVTETVHGFGFEACEFVLEEYTPLELPLPVSDDLLDEEDWHVWSDHHRLAAEMKRPEMRMGDDPIVILIPLRFGIRERHTAGPYLVASLANHTLGCWGAQRPSEYCPRAYSWEWIWFWKAQARFWTLQHQVYPELVALGSDGVVEVNAFLYRRLAEHCAVQWKYCGEYQGGYVDPSTPRIQNAKWNYGAARKPRSR